MNDQGTQGRGGGDGIRRTRKRSQPKIARPSERRSEHPPEPTDGAGSAAHASESPPRMTEPETQEVLSVALGLGRTLSADMHEDEIVHAYVDALRNLFAGRLLAVRLFVPDTGDLTVVYATGRLRPDGRDAIDITHRAIEAHGIDLKSRGPAKARCVEHYIPLFKEGIRGFDFPILDGERLIGIFSVEYPSGVRPPPGDETVIGQLVLQLGSALKNARIFRQSLSPRTFQSKFLDNASMPIIVVGDHGQVQFANRAFMTVTGFTQDELLGQDWLSLLPESERQRVLPTYINALRGEPVSNIEVKLPCRDGGSAHMAAVTASIVNADDEIEGVIYVFRDIGKENPTALRQLVAGVVHELNNPLTNISVYGEYLLKKNQQSGAESADIEKLRRIVASSVRIRNFTRDLVAYARPSNEKPTLAAIEEIVDQAVMFCEHLIEETGAAVEKRYCDGLSKVYGVKSQLVQIFVNLITNACHAMPKDAGFLVLETAPHGDNKLSIMVTDSGSGIPEDNLDRIFEPFFTTKGQGMGTGLGLSIIKNIIEQHRGTISVQSEVGSGTTFEVVLGCRPEPKVE